MLKKYSYAVLVFLPILIVLIWVASINIELAKAKQVTIRIKGYDPRDLLSGHYIYYQIDWNNTDCTQFEDNTCPRKAFKNAHRFYIDETKASDLEKKLQNTDNIAEIIFSYRRGYTPLAQKLLINGKE